MLVLGLLWCYGWADALQGETPGEPNDNGLIAGYVVHYLVIGGFLVFLWWRRVHSGLILVAPIAIETLLITLVLTGVVPDTTADQSDTSTFADGFVEVFWYTFPAVVIFVVTVILLSSRE